MNFLSFILIHTCSALFWFQFERNTVRFTRSDKVNITSVHREHMKRGDDSALVKETAALLSCRLLNRHAGRYQLILKPKSAESD